MGKPANTHGLTAKEVRNRLDYDSETGIFKWKIDVAKNIKAGTVIDPLRNHGNRVQITINKHQHYLNRIAWLHFYGSWPTNLVDHINGCVTDNRISNLRDVSISTNGQNLRKPTSRNRSSFLGVGTVGKRFRALIVVNGRQRYLGTFDTAEAAHQTYIIEKRKHHAGCTI